MSDYLTNDELLGMMAQGIGGVYRRGDVVVVWVDQYCKPSKPILRGEGRTLDDAIMALAPVNKGKP